MNRVELLRRYSRKAAPVFKRFIDFDPDTSDLYCFFEGNDDGKYYRIRLEMYSDVPTQQHHFLICGGKRIVSELYDIIELHPEYKNIRVLYFTDRDFDIPIKNDPNTEAKKAAAIYETPCYSVENLYSNEHTFQNILKTEFGLDIADEDFNNSLILFKDRQKEFHNAITLINAWISCHRDVERENGESKLNLKENDTKKYITKIVHISLEKVEKKYSLESLEKDFINSVKIAEDVIEEKTKYFKGTDRQCFFRGKYEFFFFLIFLSKLKDDAVNKKPEYFSKKLKMAGQLKLLVTDSDSISNMLGRLSSSAITPNCLTEYIKRFNNN